VAETESEFFVWVGSAEAYLRRPPHRLARRAPRKTRIRHRRPRRESHRQDTSPMPWGRIRAVDCRRQPA